MTGQQDEPDPHGETHLVERSPAPGAQPRRIAGCELLEELGRGGMGVVYKAHHLKTGRIEAIKLLRQPSGSSRALLQRFGREAEALGRLNHPYIVYVTEVGEDGGIPFIRMQYVHPGRTLADLLQERPPLDELLRIYRQVLLAVAHAHDQGVVHRDLKPGNVLISLLGAARLTDFGLALLASPDDRDRTRVTHSGEQLGTPHYMAPEQIEGHRGEIGRQTDIYALGVMLYEILTGKLPFEAATRFQLFLQILERDPPAPRELDPEIPRHLERTCLRAMSRDPQERHASCAELLKGIEGDTDEAASSDGRWGARGKRFSVLALVLGFIAAGIWSGAETTPADDVRIRIALNLVNSLAALIWCYLDAREHDRPFGWLWAGFVFFTAPLGPAAHMGRTRGVRGIAILAVFCLFLGLLIFAGAFITLMIRTGRLPSW